MRIALGARHGHILTMVLKRSAVVTAAGLAAGIAAAAFLTAYVKSMLYGVGTFDLTTVLLVTIVLAAVAAAAALIPARRAARIDPLVALRTE